jgi:O-antigen/teichoic acid export membrane protein
MSNSLRNFLYRLLRQSERFFRTDMVYLTKGGFWLAFGHAMAIIIGLILTLGFANLLSKESFGTYKFILSVSGIMTAFSLTGLPSAMIRSIAKGFDNALTKSFRANIKWSFAIFIGGLFGGLYYFLNGNNTLALSLLIVGSLSPFMTSASLYGSFLEGKKDFRKKSLYGMLQNSVPAIFLLGTIYLVDNPLIIVLVYFISNTAITMVLFYHTLRSSARINAREDTSLLSYSKHLSLMNILATITYHIDKVLIFHFLGTAPLAIYTFAIAPINQLESPGKFIAKLALPKLSEQKISDIHKTLPRKIFVLFVSMLGLVALYITIAPYIFDFLFPKYIESVPFSQVYALTLLFTPGMLFGQTLTAHMKTKALYITKIVGPMVNISLLIILLPLFGIWGAIATLITTHALNFMMAAYFFRNA